MAVKVRYPGLAAALEQDLQNAESLVRALGVGTSPLDRREYIEEIRREVMLELDYRREQKRAEDFRTYFARWPDLVVPRAHPFLCTAKVLVLERLEGPTLHACAQSLKLKRPGAAERGALRSGGALGARGVRAFPVPQVIHGDAHPENFIVLDGGRRLGVLDYG